VSRTAHSWLAYGFLALVSIALLAQILPVPAARGDPAAPDTVVVRVSPADVTVQVNQAFAIELVIENAANVGSYQVDLLFDPDLLMVTDVVPGSFLVGGDRTAVDLGPVIKVERGMIRLGTISYGAGEGASGSGVLATVNFVAGTTPGTSPLTLDELQVIGVDGALQDATGQGGSVTIEPLITTTPTPTATSTATSTPTPTPTPTATTAGTGGIAGTVQMQGRGTYDGATISVDATPVATTAPDGSFNVSAVPAGQHTVSAAHQGYLTAENSSLSVTAGNTTELAQVTLVGGDAVYDGVINIFDLVMVGVHFGESPPGDPSADINEDGRVNIFDLVLVGLNFGKVGPTEWPPAALEEPPR